MEMTRQPTYLTELLSTMQKQLDRLEQKQDDQTTILTAVQIQTNKTNGRVLRTEADIKALQRKRGRVSGIPPNVLYLVAVAAVVVLFIIANLMGVHLPGLSL